MFYKKYKNNNLKSKGYGWWYLRPVKVADVDLESLAQSMQGTGRDQLHEMRRREDGNTGRREYKNTGIQEYRNTGRREDRNNRE